MEYGNDNNARNDGNFNVDLENAPTPDSGLGDDDNNTVLPPESVENPVETPMEDSVEVGTDDVESSTEPSTEVVEPSTELFTETVTEPSTEVVEPSTEADDTISGNGLSEDIRETLDFVVKSVSDNQLFVKNYKDVNTTAIVDTHTIWDKPIETYTVTEGMLTLIFLFLLAMFIGKMVIGGGKFV